MITVEVADGVVTVAVGVPDAVDGDKGVIVWLLVVADGVVIVAVGL
jgi:hypothetical protein